MTGIEIGLSVFLALLAVVFFVMSFLQFANKGYCFNNAYIYASKEERETMDKKPYYKQSGIVFLLLGAADLFTLAAVIFHAMKLIGISSGIVAATVVYAIISSAKINKDDHK